MRPRRTRWEEYAPIFAQHALEELTAPPDLRRPLDPPPPVRCFRMARPDTRNMLVLITFTPEGVVIQGDVLWPSGLYGHSTTCISTRGYAMPWFLGEHMGADYLAEKFHMPWCWSAERAATSVRWEIGQCRRDGDRVRARKLLALARRLDARDQADTHACDWRDIDTDRLYGDEIPGYDYPEEMHMLAAVQRRFAALYRELFQRRMNDAMGGVPIAEVRS